MSSMLVINKGHSRLKDSPLFKNIYSQSMFWKGVFDRVYENADTPLLSPKQRPGWFYFM